ncbi:hypothetical protein [Mesorhizobium sp. M0968]|uniref:hypothetical protein n=1 Tax=Mesorhizobium sp. M0968 TaxID=2957037 RepID=UPI00333DAF68
MLAAVILLPTYTDALDYCPKEEDGVMCVREWFGTASGYFATIVAAITITYLYQQNNELKKQTQFTIGDASATLDVVPHHKTDDEIVVRIVNWNRRSLLLRRVEIIGMDCATFVLKAEVDDVLIPDVLSPNFEPPIDVNGWEDRNDKPHVAKLRVFAMDPTGSVRVRDWPAGTRVAVTAQVVGDRHDKKILTGDVMPEG